MDRTQAYVTLCTELEHWRRRPFDDLVRLVGASPSVNSLLVEGELIEVEIRVKSAGAKSGAIRIEAVANGPSCWKLERLEEAITVSAASSGTTEVETGK